MKQPDDNRGVDAVRSIEDVAADLKKLSDEIKWRNHRATSEVRDAVQVIATELERTAKAIKESAPALAQLRADAAAHGHLALLEAKDRVALLEDLVRAALHGAARSPSFIGETARLKLALAKMDASDVFEEKRRVLEEERRRLATLVDATLQQLDERLRALGEQGRPAPGRAPGAPAQSR